MTLFARPILFALILTGLATAADANCTVTYKAKRDNPLKLEAGSVSLSGAACANPAAAAAALQPMLAEQGWTLLAITAIIPAG